MFVSRTNASSRMWFVACSPLNTASFASGFSRAIFLRFESSLKAGRVARTCAERDLAGVCLAVRGAAMLFVFHEVER